MSDSVSEVNDPNPLVSSTSSLTSPINALMDVLHNAKTDPQHAELNKKSISDGRGGRIELDENFEDSTNLLNKVF